MVQKLWSMVFGSWPMTKRNMFLVILLIIGLVSILASVLARVAVLDLDTKNAYRVALVAPLSGPNANTGRAMRAGAQLAVDRINADGGIGGRAIAVEFHDDEGTAAKARGTAEALVANDQLSAIIGHYGSVEIAAGLKAYSEGKTPVILPSPAAGPEAAKAPWVFATVFDDLEQTKFLANYLRNVVGQKTVSVIHASTDRGTKLAQAFDETYRRFGTKVLNSWQYNPNNLDALLTRAETIGQEFRDQKITGHIFIQGTPAQAARVLVGLRNKGVRNGVVGLADMATDAFVREVQSLLPKGDSAALMTNGMMVTTPLLFDTATEVAQNFRAAFIDAYGTVPDWAAAYSFDAVTMIADGIRDGLVGTTEEEQEEVEVTTDVGEIRASVRRGFARYDAPQRSKRTVGGQRYFGPDGENRTSVQIGLFNGSSQVSALTQLQPILEQGVTGYLDLLKAGKVLYVNDRFMYKTNVVYTGVQILNAEEVFVETGEEVRALKDRLELDFLIWFRYRGDFQPEDVVFVNAAEPIRLEEPDKSGIDGDMLYRSYRVNGQFKLEFSDVAHPYGTLLAGLGFHHRLLSRNNLMYVTDVLGMGLVNSDAGNLVNYNALARVGVSNDEADPIEDVEEEDSGFLGLGFEMPTIDLAALLGQPRSGDVLLSDLTRNRVFAPMEGWRPERAWVSQEVYAGASEGDPTFVGFGKQTPDFVRIDFGIILGNEGIDLGAVIPANWLVYISIFAIVVILVAGIMDRKERGQFWRVQTLFMRVVAWPMLMLAGGAVLLDFSVSNWPDSLTDIIVIVLDSLWWVIPARLAAIGLERFIWVPLEMRSQRRIPNVVRLFAAGAIYLFAVFGVLAFVLEQTLTGILATSGLLAMIIGLAVQANIANIFSGIVLNIERPFRVGDWVQIDETIGNVMDITWRTMRLRTRDGFHVSIPNGQVSEALIQNFSTGNMVRFSAEFFIAAKHAPDDVGESIDRAEERIRRSLSFVGLDEGLDRYSYRYDGLKVFERGVFHRFRVDFWIDEYNDYEIVRQFVYGEVWLQFQIDEIDTDLKIAPPKSQPSDREDDDFEDLDGELAEERAELIAAGLEDPRVLARVAKEKKRIKDGRPIEDSDISIMGRRAAKDREYGGIDGDLFAGGGDGGGD